MAYHKDRTNADKAVLAACSHRHPTRDVRRKKREFAYPPRWGNRSELRGRGTPRMRQESWESIFRESPLQLRGSSFWPMKWRQRRAGSSCRGAPEGNRRRDLIARNFSCACTYSDITANLPRRNLNRVPRLSIRSSHWNCGCRLTAVQTSWRAERGCQFPAMPKLYRILSSELPTPICNSFFDSLGN